MRLHEYLDKGHSLGANNPCLTMGDRTWSYEEVQRLSCRIARVLQKVGVKPGESVAILSSNDAVAFTSVFGITRAGAVWCPVNPRNEVKENSEALEGFDCVALLYKKSYVELVDQMRPRLPNVRAWICVDDELQDLAGHESAELFETPGNDDLAMIVGTGGTTGRPKGVMLTGQNLETMTALTLMGYPFEPRPVYLALAPLTHAAGVLCFPILSMGGEVVIMTAPDLAVFLERVQSKKVTHTFMPPTLIYMLLAHPKLESSDLSSLQCFWYGAAPMSAARLEEALSKLGPMAQLFGQSEAPMMISMLHPKDHFNADGTVARERLSSAGRPAPLVTVQIMDGEGKLLAQGERGEIVVRSSLVMRGYYKNPEATAEASRFGWHHTGDIGYLDANGYLFIVDRAKDMIITGGFNVYSAEVEQALMQHPAVQDCAVVGLPDDKWGERVTAVLQLKAGATVEIDEIKAFVKERIGSVKAPKQVELWADLPRSKVGKVLKKDVRARLIEAIEK